MVDAVVSVAPAALRSGVAAAVASTAAMMASRFTPSSDGVSLPSIRRQPLPLALLPQSSLAPALLGDALRNDLEEVNEILQST